MIAIFDYGAGNLHSLLKALSQSGRRVALESDIRRAIRSRLLVLPGVGAFAAAAARIGDARHRVRDALRDGLPCLGICLGMQLLFDASDEGTGEGIGLVTGRVTRLAATRVPQIGWNAVDAPADPLFQRSGLRTAYFANSFVCRPDDLATVVAWSVHEQDRFPAAIRVARTIGVQFHPEKSSAPGVAFVQRLLDDLLEE